MLAGLLERKKGSEAPEQELKEDNTQQQKTRQRQTEAAKMKQEQGGAVGTSRATADNQRIGQQAWEENIPREPPNTGKILYKGLKAPLRPVPYGPVNPPTIPNKSPKESQLKKGKGQKPY